MDWFLAFLGLAVIGGVGWVFADSLRENGAAMERAKQAAAEKLAVDIADQVQNDVGAIPPDKRREELRRW